MSSPSGSETKKRPITIALAGNPNCGKTTLFNALTGSTQYVGNWPGVTVEKKDGRLRKHSGVVVQDLPGIYSLSPYSQEEVVARGYLVDETPDVILNIVDGTNIERNLYLTTQLIELGIPTVVAVNMLDVLRKTGDTIDLERLSLELHCPVVGISALTGEGTLEAAELALKVEKEHRTGELPHVFSGSVEHALAHIEETLQGRVPADKLRWFAIKVFERDEKVLSRVGLNATDTAHIEQHIVDCEHEMEDDAESIITNQRYAYIQQVVSYSVKKVAKKGTLTWSDKIDRIVTNRVLALPIFAVVMWFMYYISVTTIGAYLTDWMNDQVFGDGWFLRGGSGYEEAVAEREKHSFIVTKYHAAVTEKAEDAEGGGVEAVSVLLTREEAGNRTVELEMPVDDEDVEAVLEKRLIDYDIYAKSFAALEAEDPNPTDYGVWVPGIPALAEAGLDKIEANDVVKSLILDGVISGVGTVLGFVPQILLVFLFLAFLEDCGYMARIAFIMDRLFRRFGLSGKSFIPMLVGTGCGVPGIMASRTIESLRDRRMTILLCTFIPCGAKVEIIAAITGAFFPGSMWVAPSMFFLGIAIIILAGIALKKTAPFLGDPSPFVMELPAYHMPTIRGILIHMWERGRAFCIKAGTIIFSICVVLWFLMSFSWNLTYLGPEGLESSMLASIGNVFAWLFTPLGFGNWKGAVAVVSAELAKEQAVATLGMLAGVGEEAVNEGLMALFKSFSAFPALAAFSFMLANLFNPPCLVAIVTSFREMGSRAWGWAALLFQILVGYGLAFMAYQLGKVLFYNQPVLGVGPIVAIVLLSWIVWAVVRPASKLNSEQEEKTMN
ncbi:MAG: ferrous iron transporter B [Kiritimatiellia bacterium]